MAVNQPSTKSAHGSEGDLPELDVLTLIARDHLFLEQLLNDYQRAGGKDEKRQILERTLKELKEHEDSEELAFWPRVREKIPMGDILVSRRREEEEEGKMIVSALQTVEPGTPDFEARLHALIKGAIQHATEEEKEIFPRVLESFRGTELLAMGKDFLAAKKAAKK